MRCRDDGAPGRLRPDSAADRTAFAHLLEEAFPPQEREDAGALLDDVARGRRACLVVRGADEGLDAFAVLSEVPSLSACCLEYLAVRAALRGAGLGARLLVRAQQACRARDGLLLEVEPPSTSRQAERRATFYLRHGATLLPGGDRYVMPVPSGAGVLPMHLMALAPPDSPLRRVAVEQAAVALWTEVYEVDPERLALLRRALSGRG